MRSLPTSVRALLLVVVSVVAYLPSLHNGFIWDDNAHITKPELRSEHGLIQIWTEPGATQQYYPLVHSVFWIEHRLWGDSVVPYHLINILLHAICAVILFKILLRLKVPGAWLVAALFALHPVQVESVAWISELKNTLSGAFFLSSALVYLSFDQTRNRIVYVASLALFLSSLMSKTVIAPLPAILLVVLWWKRGRLSWPRDVLPLLPFFGLGIAAGLFTAWVEHHFVGAQGGDFNLSILDRCLIAGRDFWFYLFKLLWPEKLIFIYPRWQISQAVWQQYLFPATTLVLFALLWKMRTRWRGPLAALLFFLDLLFPSLGFINVFPFIYSFVADHFQYLACIGPLTLVGAGITIGLDSFGPRIAFLRPLLCTLLVLTLGTLTWRQSRQYTDIETLWRATLVRNPDCWLAHHNLGVQLLETGRATEAEDHFRTALRLRPRYFQAENNLGEALLVQNRLDEAEVHIDKSIELNPSFAASRWEKALVCARKGKKDEAYAIAQAGMQQRTIYLDGLNNFAWLLATSNDARIRDAHNAELLARRGCEVTRYANPHFLDTLAAACAAQGRFAEAREFGNRALALAASSTSNAFAREIAGRLKLYEAGRSYSTVKG